MTDLITRLQQAEGPDGELDAEVYVSLFGGEVRAEHYRKGLAGEEFEMLTGVSPVKTEDGWLHRKAPSCTASIDAALALIGEVLPGWGIKMALPSRIDEVEPPGLVRPTVFVIWAGGKWDEKRPSATGTHKSPAIALLIALLTAIKQGGET